MEVDSTALVQGHRLSDPGPGLPQNPSTHQHRISDPMPGLPGAIVDSSKPVEQTATLLDKAKKAAEVLGESSIFTSVMTIFTFWALFQGDIKFSATDKSADDAFEVIISILFFAFLFEIFLQSFYKEDYCSIPSWQSLPDETFWETWYRRIQLGGFYFWLDIIATLSLLLDVR